MTRKLMVLGISFCLLLISASCAGRNAGVKPEGIKAEAAASTDEPVKKDDAVTAFRAGDFVNAFGQVTAMTYKNIIIGFPAAVEKVNVREGQRVADGDSLITLNLKEYNAQIKQKELELNSEQAAVSQINNSYFKNNNDSEIRKLMNDLNTARSTYDKTLKELSEKQELYKAGSISKRELEESQETVNNNKKEMDNINLSIVSIKNGKQLELDTRKANLAKLQSELQIMKDRLVRPYIRGNDIVSDIRNGAVYEISYAPGDIIGEDDKALSLIDLDSLIVKAEIGEKYIKYVNEGSEVLMTPRADNSRQYTGKVIRISSVSVSRDDGAYTPVEVSIDNRDEFLLPNYYVDVRISTGKKQ